MIISRTPYRVSFFGGGTDYPAWCEIEDGAVLTTTIDKYCYITCRHLPPFFEHKTRIVYSKIEMVKSLEEIDHPAAREVLRFLDIFEGLEIHHDGDLPARSGIGSSSAFTVGLLKALYALIGKKVSREKLAEDGIYVEQKMIGENVGSQDQLAVAYGGLNRIAFFKNESVIIKPIILKEERLSEFQDHLMLFFTGFSRNASEIAGRVIRSIPKNTRSLIMMRDMVDEALSILSGNGDILEFGKLLNDSWCLKKSISTVISNSRLDEIYQAAIDAGATGGKVLGAGGGGFFLFFARPSEHVKIIERLGKYLYVPFRFEFGGSQIVFSDPNDLEYAFDKSQNSYVYKNSKCGVV